MLCTEKALHFYGRLEVDHYLTGFRSATWVPTYETYYMLPHLMVFSVRIFVPYNVHLVHRVLVAMLSTVNSTKAPKLEVLREFQRIHPGLYRLVFHFQVCVRLFLGRCCATQSSIPFCLRIPTEANLWLHLVLTSPFLDSRLSTFLI